MAAAAKGEEDAIDSWFDVDCYCPIDCMKGLPVLYPDLRNGFTLAVPAFVVVGAFASFCLDYAAPDWNEKGEDVGGFDAED